MRNLLFVRRGRQLVCELKKAIQTGLDTVEMAQGPHPREWPAWLWIKLLNGGLDMVLGSGGTAALNGMGNERDEVDERIAADLREIVARLKAEYGSAESGDLDYEGLRGSAELKRLCQCTGRLRGFDPRRLGTHDERMAFWINLYSTLTVHAIVEFEVRGSVLRRRGFFRRARYAVGEFVLSLDEIEHGILRGNRAPPYFPSRIFPPGDPRRELVIGQPDPRVHFALNCGSRSCPPIAAYDADRLDEQLTTAAWSFLESGGMEVDLAGGEMALSKLLKWYAGDFGGRAGVVSFLKNYVEPRTAEALDGLRIRWRDYDWSLNQTG